MEIKKEYTVILTVDELTKLIKQHVASQGIKVTDIYFDINGHEQEGDWQSAQALTYKLDRIRLTGVDLK